jgi:hypothetical protein
MCTTSNYQTSAIRISLFSAIELSERRISNWRIQETIRQMDMGLRPQSVRLSDIELTKLNIDFILNNSDSEVLILYSLKIV